MNRLKIGVLCGIAWVFAGGSAQAGLFQKFRDRRAGSAACQPAPSPVFEPATIYISSEPPVPVPTPPAKPNTDKLPAVKPVGE